MDLFNGRDESYCLANLFTEENMYTFWKSFAEILYFQ